MEQTYQSLDFPSPPREKIIGLPYFFSLRVLDILLKKIYINKINKNISFSTKNLAKDIPRKRLIIEGYYKIIVSRRTISKFFLIKYPRLLS